MNRQLETNEAQLILRLLYSFVLKKRIALDKNASRRILLFSLLQIAIFHSLIRRFA